MAYTVQAKIASCGYHVYKNVNWENVKAGEKVTTEIKSNKDSIKIEPYCCAVKAMVGNPAKLAIVGHIPREISRHVCSFLKEKGEKVEGFAFSTKYRPSPNPAGGLNTSDVEFQDSPILNTPENQELSCLTLLLGL